MSDNLPFSQACENNKNYILEVLDRHLSAPERVLEIGGGTGQHAEHFTKHLPHLNWQATDLANNVDSLNQRILKAGRANLPRAIALDVTQHPWDCGNPSHIFTANSLHIMAESSVREFFAGTKEQIVSGGFLFVYGPFKYQGEFTSESNASFDLWLKARNPVSGVRDFETVNDYAANAGLVLLEDNDMPANNQLLVWRKQGSAA
jgi:cyclopropane fatty-acyl-phospholipid synthase-like methyltransferase